MKKYLFIINPIAGGGRAKSVEPLIEETMKRNQKDFRIIFTQEPREAISIASNAEYDVVVAVGGDGTVNEVASGLVKKGKGTLGIIPVGTGNDLSRSLNIPQDPKEALELIIKGRINEITVGESNTHHFLNISSVGFDVEVLVNTDKIRKLIKGKLAYVLGVIYSFFKYRKKYVTLELDGRSFDRNILLMAVGKGKYYGGGMMVLPNADLYDNYLHICLVRDISNLKGLTLFPVIFKGNHLRYKQYVEVYKAKEVKVINKSSLDLNVDGEVLKEGNSITFRLGSRKIPVIS